MHSRTHAEIAAMKGRELSPESADYLMIEAVQRGVLPASQLPRVMQSYERPAPRSSLPGPPGRHQRLHRGREVAEPSVQVETSFRLASTFRSALAL